MGKRKRKVTPLPTLVAKAWACYSAYIRKRNADHTGTVCCVSCGIPKHYSELHAGHFVHCSKQSRLSYDERNIHPQCRQCNYYGMSGLAAIRYTQFMTSKYGEGIVDELISIKHEKTYLGRQDLEAIVETFGHWKK